MHNTNVHNIFFKISDATCDTSLQQDEEVFALLVEAGYRGHVSFSSRDEIVSTLIYIFLFLKVKAAMDQFRDGLETGGLLHYMTKYPDALRPLFVDESSPFTASKCSMHYIL